MTESTYDPVFYIPKGDVRLELLEATDHSTHCPFKGDASYWSIASGGATAVNAVWAYDDPKPKAETIRERFAFYRGKGVDLA